MTPLMSGMLLCVLMLTLVLMLAYGQLKQVEKTVRRRNRNKQLEWDPMLAALRTLPPGPQELEKVRARQMTRREIGYLEKVTESQPGVEMPWWAWAALMERQGYPPEQIARELDIPAAEVQLVLALGYPSRGS